jgi:hypothetical protein
VGCDEEEQEVVHTAGLLHDIGKFTWSDRILHPERLTDEDWAVIHRHPQDGAALVGKLDGYGPVADAILYHHERVDGGGYPAGLIGNEIPLASRIVAICSTYDRMTARETYRSPMTPAGRDRRAAEDRRPPTRRRAGRELHRAARARGPAHSPNDADFEVELAFEQPRSRKIAQPSHS